MLLGYNHCMGTEETEKNKEHSDGDGGVTDKLAGMVQKTIGGLEEIGGILTADPITAAEGEYNVEVCSIREEIGEDMEESEED